MAKLDTKVLSFFLKWEGGLSKDPRDRASRKPCPTRYNQSYGWHTNRGITYETWVAFHGKNNDKGFFEMTHEDVEDIFKRGYWDKVKGDKIKSGAIAATLVSWAWGSGPRTAIKLMQGVVKVKKDGILGPKTLKAINDFDEKELFELGLERREKFFNDICKNRPANYKFLRGWLNRLRDFEQVFKP